MFRLIAVLASIMAAVVVFAGTGAQAAASSQTLGITLHRNAAATERLPEYRSAAPITVNVGGYARHLKTLTVTAHGPGGEAVSAPLARNGDTFSGDLRLLAPGTWTVALSTQLGTVSAALASVPLDVVSDDGADFAARMTFALAALCIIVGLALVVPINGRPAAFAYARKRS